MNKLIVWWLVYVKHVLVPLRDNHVLRWGRDLSKCLGYLELLRVQ